MVPKGPDTMSNCSSLKPVPAPKFPDTVSKYSSPKPVTVPNCPDTALKCSSSESKSQGRVTRKYITSLSLLCLVSVSCLSFPLM